MVRKLSRRFATNRELIRILLFIFKAPTSQKVYLLGLFHQIRCEGAALLILFLPSLKGCFGRRSVRQYVISRCDV